MTPTLTAEEAAEKIAELAALLVEARACLEPFAKYPTTEAMEDDEIVGIGFRYLGDNDSLVSGPGFLITAGHLRAAAALHEKLGMMG